MQEKAQLWVGGVSVRPAESVDVILANISGSQNAARIPTT